MSSVAMHHPEIIDHLNGSPDDFGRPASRKPRPKPARFVRLCVRPAGTAPGVVRITVGHESTDYFLFTMSRDFGRGFRLEKIGVEGKDEHYHVRLGNKPECDCKGHTHHGHCKHADGLAALIAAGTL
jgi:hypothetical protein